MAYVLPAMTFFAAAPPAGEPSVLRIEPPSWWSAAEPQAIGLLVEGHDLDGATALSGNPSMQVARVEPGLDGRALWIEVTIPAHSRPGALTIEIGAHGQRLSLLWTILRAPD
jgi:hypothetical protein